MAKTGYFFRAWRKHRKMTQAQLADSVEMTESSISQIENGKQGFTIDTLEAIAIALQCSAGDLLLRDPKDASATAWATLSPTERRRAMAVVEALKRTE